MLTSNLWYHISESDYIMPTIGEHIKSMREKRYLTQKELAKQAGISENSHSPISHIENGIKAPTYEQITSIGKLFGFASPAEFFQGVDTWDLKINELNEIEELRLRVIELERQLKNQR